MTVMENETAKCPINVMK